MPKSVPTSRAPRVRPATAERASPSTAQPLPAERPDHDLDHSVGYLLNRAASIIAARFSDDLKAHNINLQTWRVLAALRHEDHQTLSDLASHTGSELSYLSRAVSALETKGYIQRSESPSDRRNIHLSITAAGAAIVAELAPRAWQIERMSMKGVTPSELAITLKTLRAVYSNLVDSCEDASVANRKLTVARRARRREARDEASE
ncbi:MarR family transcriptional regulator (plasmid) [Paraburkholderia sp. D15]|uniref:MarR family winged helix-turn-helix transcriptional regulator n=1 Tax=Paraburkholderia sp. D15 TaxID=2880218 RepID=UPI0024799985|nr:MarR family transcriptional regulator [Paraburkholderia sp. D15]WGS55151.1 MarR family transcriptional regulator [Paraburkholderia sp. D15]